MKTLLMILCLLLGTMTANAQQYDKLTDLRTLSLEEMRKAIWSYPKDKPLYVDNDPTAHPARNAPEFMDSLFYENPMRTDYEQYGKYLMNRFRKDAVCSFRGEELFSVVDSIDKQGTELAAEDYWREILKTNLPGKVLKLQVLTKSVKRFQLKPQLIDVQQLRTYIWRNITPRYEYPENSRKYFDKLGVSTDGVKFVQPKIIRAN